MRGEQSLDGLGRNLAARDVDHIIDPAAEADGAAPNYRQVARGIDPASQFRHRLGPIRFAHGPTTHFEAARVIDAQDNIGQSRAHTGGVRARRLRRVVGDAATFAGSVKIMNLDPALLKNFPLQLHGQGCSRRNGEPRRGWNRARVMPHPPERGHGGQGQRGPHLPGPAHRLGQRHAAKHQRDAVQEQWRDEVREAVGVRQGNDGEVRPVVAQAHRRHDVVRIGGELGGGEGDELGRAARGRGRLHMHERRGEVREFRGRLADFQRTNDLPVSPRPQHTENKFRPVTARKNHRVLRLADLRDRIQFGEGPLPRGRQIAQRDFSASLARHLAPAVVKHCLFGSAPIT